MDPFDRLLDRQYNEGDEGKETLALTGFVYEHCCDTEACKKSYPHVLYGEVYDGSRLALILADRDMQLSQWSFAAIDNDNEDQHGVTFISPDCLYFSQEDDLVTAKLLLSRSD